jgi:FkbM family methyltransferase
MEFSHIIRTYGEVECKIYCNLDNDIRAQKINKALPGYIYPFTHKIWSFLVLSFDWQLILDIGANYGEFTCDAYFYSSVYQPKIISIEPGKNIFKYLEKTLKEISTDLEPQNVCISSTQATKLFRENLSSSGGSRLWNENLPFRNDQSIYQVQSKKLGEYLKNYKTALIKVDTEGNEIDILSSLTCKDLNQTMICFLIEINQLDFSEFIASHPDLSLFIFSKIHGKFIKNPSPFIYKKYMRKFFYMQDGLITNSLETEEVISRFKMNIYTLFKWKILNIKFKS